MSTLLEQASLVMIPSGYKEDVVYSQIPTNGNGDLSFTRASNGTRVNSAGLVEVVAWNLYSDSENLTLWPSFALSGTITRTANYATAPNGTMTATRIQNSGGTTTQWTYQSLNLINGGTISMYVKRTGSTDQTFRFFGNNGAESSADFTATSEWQRFEFFVLPSGSVTPQGITTASTGNATDILVWGAQVNIGSTAKPYFPTTDRLNVPRLTYQNGGGNCPSLLLEKQSTNLATYSEQIDNAVWTKANATVNANVSASPDGTSNADKVIPSTSVAFHNVTNSLILTIGTVYTISAFAKADGYNYVAIGNGFGTRQALFNLSNGDITKVTSSTTAEIKNYGNGWYRCSITFETTNTANQLQITVDNGSDAQYAGNGTSGAFIWGTSVEIGSYTTSYIPTTSSSATRVADACFKTGISSLIGQSQGTMFVDVDLTHSNLTGANEYLMQLYQAAGERVILYRTSSNELSCYYLQGATSFFKVTTITTNGRHKLAFAYKSGDSAFYIDGVQLDINTTTFSAFSNLNELQIGANFNPTQAEIGAYNYNEAIIFPTRLTNAELASLTTI